MTYFLYNMTLFIFFNDRFEVIGYGCATCVGNTAPLPEAVVDAIKQVIVSYSFFTLFILCGC